MDSLPADVELELPAPLPAPAASPLHHPRSRARSIAAVRVGPQPYAILSTSHFAAWRPTAGKISTHGFAVGAATGIAAVPDRTEAVLLHVLRRLDQAWSLVSPGPAQVGAPGAGAQRLLDVLGLHPNSVEFYQRVGYSWDYLKNLESFAAGGSDFEHVWGMVLESMATRQFLAAAGRQLDAGRREGQAHPPAAAAYLAHVPHVAGSQAAH